MTSFAPINPFHSYWLAGYEGVKRIDEADASRVFNDSTQHLQRVRDDYRLLDQFGIRTIRENVAWHLVEIDGAFDFSSLTSRACAAREMRLQVIWNLCHHDWPSDVNARSGEFAQRFARYCRNVALYLAPFSDAVPVYSPMNGISLACRNLANRSGISEARRQEEERAVKRQLVRAVIAGCDAIREVNPDARILHCDSGIHVAAPADRPGLEAAAEAATQAQFEAWDMLAGRVAPELGGAPRYLDLIGMNYHPGSQWEFGTNQVLEWHLDDPRRRPLHALLTETYRRYRRPILLSETSHIGGARGAWIRELAQEAVMARNHGVELFGICLSPVVDRPDLDDAGRWNFRGLWDAKSENGESCRRVLSQAYAAALLEAQRLTGRFCPTYMPFRRQGDRMPAMIVFSHLRWDFVYQRPQHLLSRLAQHYQIVFVEEPVFDETESRWEISTPVANVSVCQPRTSIAMPGFHDDQLPQMRKLVRQLAADHEDHIVWFYTPMALPLLQELHPRLVVYDCMDEPASSRNAPKQLLQRENAVLKVADIVFTGGPSLYRAKLERHPNVHCFPSSVDATHFTQALDRTNSHPAHKDIPGPRLGFYGAIDERFDTELIGQLADAHPQWQIVLVGPVVRIDPSTLPTRENIHYLGPQPYKALPYFLAGWDVCLLPFALNESTRFISPVKTLEYMAAQLPIVSTPVTDVADLYRDIIYIAADAPQFVAACEAALLESSERRADNVEKMRGVVSQTSWDATVEKMHALLESAHGTRKPSLIPAAEPADLDASINPLRWQTWNAS